MRAIPLACFVLFAAAGCGYKGPLVLPKPKPEVQKPAAQKPPARPAPDTAGNQ